MSETTTLIFSEEFGVVRSDWRKWFRLPDLETFEKEYLKS